MFAIKTVIKIMSNRKYKALILFFISVFGFSAIRAIYCYVHRKHHKYPSGPIGLPFIGSLVSMSDPVKLESYLSKSYGQISMLYIGQQPFVFIHSIDLINKIFNNEHCLHRDDSICNGFAAHYLQPHELGTGFSNSPFWNRKRKILQSILLSQLNSKYLNQVHNTS
eukprot:27685_1